MATAKIKKCPFCKGRAMLPAVKGGIRNQPCRRCRGTGLVWKRRQP